MIKVCYNITPSSEGYLEVIYGWDISLLAHINPLAQQQIGINMFFSLL